MHGMVPVKLRIPPTELHQAAGPVEGWVRIAAGRRGSQYSADGYLVDRYQEAFSDSASCKAQHEPREA